MLQNAPDCTIQNNFLGKHAPNPHSKPMATPSVASPPPPPQKKKKKIVGPPWQILHTPMNKMCRKVWKQFETRQGATRHWQNIILPYVLYVLTYSVFLLSQHIYLRIHPGKQLIVCSTLYVYMHYKIFLRGKK